MEQVTCTPAYKTSTLISQDYLVSDDLMRNADRIR